MEHVAVVFHIHNMVFLSLLSMVKLASFIKEINVSFIMSSLHTTYSYFNAETQAIALETDGVCHGNRGSAANWVGEWECFD